MSGVPGSTTIRNFVPVSVCTVQASKCQVPQHAITVCGCWACS
jgi:hypothetical protein